MEPCDNRKMRLSRLLTAVLLACLPWAAQGQTAGQTTPDLFSLCSFYPQGAPCPAIYQQALKDQANPASRSVRDAVTYYARYLKTPASFTDQDRAWLSHLPHFVAREVMAAWLSAHNLRGFDRKKLERLVVAAKTARPGSRFDVSDGHFLEVNKANLALAGPER